MISKYYVLALIFSFGLVMPGFVAAYADIPQYEFSINDIEWCQEVYPQYDALGLDWFIENYHYSIEARVCGNLYEDPLWDYQESDRTQKLLERSQFYIDLELSESKAEAKSGVNDPNPVRIPSWIKDVANFWISDQIDDRGFTQVIEYLVKEQIILIPNAQSPEEGGSAEIPSWIKSNAEFWVDGKISDNDFSVGLEWLINNGIIKVDF